MNGMNEYSTYLSVEEVCRSVKANGIWAAHDSTPVFRYILSKSMYVMLVLERHNPLVQNM
jgi:hypothetical protein